RFEAASARRPGWCAPLLALGQAFASRELYSRALVAFRRAIEANRAGLEANPRAVRALAHTFLRRAEQMERDGRHDIASGLVGEILTLDLRRAPSSLRFELERRHEARRRRPQP
ncbi:MAG: hypothetical protein OEY14_08200, partial [Myxococcales bacterium]|nr:hypothetical protein [Myxococcales bacterium]